MLRRGLDGTVDAAREATVMEHARRHGVPTPAVLSASGCDLVMEMVTGPSMLDDLVVRPDRAERHGRLLADLHRALDAVPPMPGHEAHDGLVHLDLHPGNVLLPAAGPVVIDWSNAGHGSRALDRATTWLVIACLTPPQPWPALDDVRADLLRALAAAGPSIDARALRRAGRTRLSDPTTSSGEATSIRRLLGRHERGAAV